MSTILTRAMAAVLIFVLLAGVVAADTPRLLRRPASATLDVTRFAPAPPARDVHSTSLGWVTLFADDLEGTFPGAWDVSDQKTGYGEYYWGQRDCVKHEGDYAAWAVGAGESGAPLSCGAKYPANASSVMKYGPFDLSDATLAEVQFQFWLQTEEDVDHLYILASTNGTRFYGYMVSGDSDGWLEDTLDLTDIPSLGNLTGQPQVWFAFWFMSDETVEYKGGAYVDEVVIRKWVGPAETTTPAATVTGTAGPTFTVTSTATPTSTVSSTLTPTRTLTGTVTSTRTTTRTATVQATTSPTVPGTPAAALRVFLPVVLKAHGPAIAPTPTATAPAAPTRTPTVPAGGELEFKGTTNQGREIEVKIKADRSAVIFVELDMEFSCEGATLGGKSSISSPSGWTISERSFTVLSNVFEVKGAFDPTFTTASGTWQGIRKTTGLPSVEICRGPVSNWNAARQ